MEANMELVRQRREKAVTLNKKERKLVHEYKVSQKVLILIGGLDLKLNLHQGPYEIKLVNKLNGTLHIWRKGYIKPINTRKVRPYYSTLQGGN